MVEPAVAPPFIGLIFVAASIVYGVCAPLVEWASNRAPIGRVIAGGTLAMAIALPLLGMVQGIIATAAAVCVVASATPSCWTRQRRSSETPLIGAE